MRRRTFLLTLPAGALLAGAGAANERGPWTYGAAIYPLDPVFNPDDALPPTPFIADLADVGGSVAGRTVEPDVLGGPDAPDIPAIIEGRHDGARLTFTKFAEGGGHVDLIDYDGEISRGRHDLGCLVDPRRLVRLVPDAAARRHRDSPDGSDRAGRFLNPQATPPPHSPATSFARAGSGVSQPGVLS